MTTTTTPSSIDIAGIIPHRFPFLLVDRITEHEPGKHICGYKNLTINEEFFQGYFPGFPVMPAVLQIEALAQLSGVLVCMIPEHQGKLGLFTGIDEVVFHRQVLPGDRLDMRAELLRLRPPIAKMAVSASVDGEPVLDGKILFALAPAKKSD